MPAQTARQAHVNSDPRESIAKLALYATARQAHVNSDPHTPTYTHINPQHRPRGAALFLSIIGLFTDFTGLFCRAYQGRWDVCQAVAG